VVVAAGFAYAVPNPVVTAISASAVTQGNPGFTITVTGSNFLPGALVSVDWIITRSRLLL
jgi:hypothetical protein